MSKKKKLNKEIYERAIKTYKYTEGYEPAMYDTMLDKELMYGTKFPTFDKNDYTKPVREYKKITVKEISRDKGNVFSTSRRLLNAVNFNENKTIAVSENLADRKTQMNEKGGIIVFPEDTAINDEINVKKIIDGIISTYVWTAGKYLNGRYKDENGVYYSEKSLSVEIIGADHNTLIEIAEKLCKAFKKESVLLKDYSNNSIFLCRC